jgi:DNA segregation ATPase FtsK/SpoIIIE, S-DNA-T family
LRESAFWVLAGLSLILLLALVSYSPTDPAFSVAGEARDVTNRMGPAGAWFADLSFLLFGQPAYLFPVLVLLAGLLLFRAGDTEDPLPTSAFVARGSGIVLTIVTSSGLATLHFVAPAMRETAGGILGQVVGFGLVQMLGLLGASVLLVVLWLAAVSLATGVSWLAVMDRTGRIVLAGVTELNILINRIRDWIEGRRARQHRQALVTRSRAKPKPVGPKIEPVLGQLEASERLERERQVPLFDPPASGELPALSLLDDPPPREGGYSEEALTAMSRLVEIKLADFGVEAEVVAVHPGPVVTRFEIKPAPGVKVSQISNLAKDLARSLSTVSVRVVEIIPGKPYVGLEIPNEVRELVTLGEIVKSQVYDELKSPLTLALGKDIGGQPMVADLQRMPHLLIAGTTGSGKSVALNAMVLSLLYKATPDNVRMIMIDPKMLELSVYEGIPHLLAPVVTDMKQAANALRWCVAEMERRYAVMAGLGVRHLSATTASSRRPRPRGRSRSGSDFQGDPGLRRRGAACAGADALRRRDHRRAGRHDDDGRQEGRGTDRKARAEGAGGRHSYDHRDAAAVGRRDHRTDQGEHSEPHRVPGVGQGGLANDPRPDGRRAAARARRHAVSAARHVDADPHSWRFRVRQRGPCDRARAARFGQPLVHR